MPLSKFLTRQVPGTADGADLCALLADVAAAVKAISAMAARGALGGAQREAQKKLDVLANEAVIAACDWGGRLAGMASGQLDAPYDIPARYRRGRFLLVFDALDAAANVEVNAVAGTIFSVLRYDSDAVPSPQEYLQSGHRQVAAGYAIYGPATMLVLTVGCGTHGFTLDREIGHFVLTHPDLTIAEHTREFAINASNERFWEAPVHRYVSECKAGDSGERGHDFNMHWIASTVAEVHRILMRGGVFLHPGDSRPQGQPGWLRLLHEANPMAWLVEQAGGGASTGRGRILDVAPAALRQRVPVVLGSRHEVERIERYHAEHDRGDDVAFVSPLFNERSLYRAGVWTTP